MTVRPDIWLVDTGAFDYIYNRKEFFKDYRPIQFMINQMNSQIKILRIKIVLLVVLIKDRTPREVKFIRVLHVLKIGYNLVSNRRLRAHKYYFHEDDNTIRHINNNNKLASAPLIKKELHELLLAGPGVHYASQNTPVNVETWHQRLSHTDYKTIPDLQKKITGINIRKPMTIIKICVVYKKTSQWQELLYVYITKTKRAEKLFHTDIIGSISFIDHNRTRFIIYNIDNAFRIHFKKCMKEKGEASRALRAWAAYFENYIGYSVQYIRLNNNKEYTKLKI